MQTKTLKPGSSPVARPVALRPATAIPRRRRRKGVPGLANAPQRLRAVTVAPATPGARPSRAELEFENLPSLDLELEVPKLQVQKSLPLPTFGPKSFGPVLITVSGRIRLAGSVRHGNPQTVAAFSKGDREADFEAKVASKFGDISLTGSVQPGKLSKMGIKLGTELLEIEFAAQADFTQPFRVSVKPKKTLRGEFNFGDWTFEGTIVPILYIGFTLDPKYVGVVARGTINAARAITVVGRGLFFAGELGVVTAVGAAAIGASIAIAGIAWIGFTLYMIGQAHRDARVLRMGREFNNGFVATLVQLTSGRALFPDTPQGHKQLWDWITHDWMADFESYGKRWVEKEDKNALGEIRHLGEVAVFQDFWLFMDLYGAAEWKKLAEHHRKTYGSDYDRRNKYYWILERQLRGGKPVGIPLVPIR
jgi:hypothetical protein